MVICVTDLHSIYIRVNSFEDSWTEFQGKYKEILEKSSRAKKGLQVNIHI